MSKELERLGKYELLERLGQGGMGEVWKARDTQLRRFVAIKFLHADLQNNPDFVSHFMREAQFVASLHHPNIIQIHDFQLTDERGSGTAAYMVMDYIEGGTLADYISTTSRKGRFPGASEIVRLFTSVGLALDYAHGQGMIHRDIKPANILLDKVISTAWSMGEPILTDFGIARLQGGSTATVTHAGVLGTPNYISPEQAQGHVVDERSDLYSLGIILYEIMTGITPFRGENPLAIMMQHVYEAPPPPALINPSISPELSDVILRSIAKDPSKRFQTASAMTIALAQAFKIAVPSSLDKPETDSERTVFNPLQPSRPVTGMASYPAVLPATPGAAFTPSSIGYQQTQVSSPANRQVATEGQLRQPAPPLSTIKPPEKPKRPSRMLLVALIACVVVLLVGLGAFAVPRLFSQPNGNNGQNTPVSDVGHITFLASQKAARNTYDQLQISLTSISTPPAGKTYYAWLEPPRGSDTGTIQQWPLQVSHGTVQGTFQGNPPGKDMYAANALFLVTAEDSGSTPVIPNPDLNAHLYYAPISHSTTGQPTFVVKQCPSSGTGNGTNPCI
ncbi:MAG TPA: serine/threonine-protein kinase [Ktedonobacteraceae bacterium]|nr:serine/threonine-protein kinase [Ktedonobacteraceae bacterium]